MHTKKGRSPKGLEPTCHKLRLAKGQRSRIDKLKLGDINLMDFVRKSVGHYLDYLEETGDLPDLPKYARAAKRKFSVGDVVLIDKQKGEIMGEAKKGWYRIKIIATEEVKLAQAKNIQKEIK